MTVRDQISVLRNVRKISLVCVESTTMNFDPEDDLMLAAFGDFKVSCLKAYKISGEESDDIDYEIRVAVQPIKEVPA